MSKESNLRYRKSEKGRAAIRRAALKYSRSEKGKNTANKFYQQYNNQRNLYRKYRSNKCKDKAIELLGGKCKDCGNIYPRDIYDFHHIGQKEFDISRVLGRKWEIIEKELMNCILLCANCHRIRHIEKN